MQKALDDSHIQCSDTPGAVIFDGFSQDVESCWNCSICQSWSDKSSNESKYYFSNSLDRQMVVDLQMVQFQTFALNISVSAA